jgi:hypothetical protein
LISLITISLFFSLSGVRFFLNLDRCAYGGETDGGFLRKTVKGGLVLVVGCPCQLPVFKFKDIDDWCAYRCDNVFGNLTCTPNTCSPKQKQFYWPPENYTNCNTRENGGGNGKAKCKVRPYPSGASVCSSLFVYLFFSLPFFWVLY